jgi:hypothetical protein
MTRFLLLLAMTTAGCASAPQPYCIPWEATREPERSTGFGPIPRSASESRLANPCEFPKEESDATEEDQPQDQP